MIKANITHKDGRPLVILGLSKVNTKKLLRGQPILIDMKPLGLDGWVTIVGGETEGDITRELAKHLKLPS